MPRTRKRTTTRAEKDVAVYEQAYEDVTTGLLSLRAAAKKYDLCHVSLSIYKKKREEAGENSVAMGFRAWNKVFTDEHEKIMADYIIRASQIYYGLSPKEIKRLAYDLATKYNLNIPPQWEETKCASKDWFTNFMKRQPQLSIRCAQPTSMARATSFNETNVKQFFDNLENVMDKYKFECKDIYNLDETGITTVQRPNRIVTKRGTRQVGALTSAERGSLLTVTCIINAVGNFIPPIFIFPRVRYHDHFVRDGPTGSIGDGNASGWMQEEQFLKCLKHFQKYTSSSVSHKVLLLLDNHSSHISIQALDYSSENGIVALSFPPHCSHKLQPLDRSVYGPLKKAVNSCCDAWMRSNPGKTMTIYNIPSIVATALPMAFTPTNIQAGFRCTGIFPYNRNIFTALDYAPSYVTDRPDPSLTLADRNDATLTEIRQTNMNLEVSPAIENNNNRLNNLQKTNSDTVPSTSNVDTYNSRPTTPRKQLEPSTSSDSPRAVEQLSSRKQLILQQTFSPEAIRPFPKASPRKNTNKRKRKRKSTIYTNTPEKEIIKEEYEEKQRNMLWDNNFLKLATKEKEL